MAKQYGPKRRRGRPRKQMKQRTPRPRGGPKQPVQYFTRSVYNTATLSVAPGSIGYANSTFTLGLLPDASDFTNLYDQYRIMGVRVTLLPRGNSSDLITQGNIGRSFSVLDYDDNNVPSSINQLCQYPNMKMVSTHKAHSRYLVPKFQRDVATGLGTIAKNPSTGWIDCTRTDVLHYGVKWAVQGPPAAAGANLVYDQITTFYLAFKYVR